MPDKFNESEYRQKLIKAGMSPEDAAALAAHTAAAKKAAPSDGSAFQAIGSALQVPPPSASEDAAPPSMPAPSAAVERSQRMAQESAELSSTMGLPPEPRPAVTKMAAQVEAATSRKSGSPPPAKKQTAGDALAAQINEVRQAAVLKHTQQQIKESQLSLFDLAPWPDHMRALPNDFGRSAIFTVRNKKIPRAALQGHPIYHVNKDVQITYTGIELRADDDELVFAQVLEYAKRVPVGEPISFTVYELCQDLDWSLNGRYYTKAEECLSRLQASALGFASERIGRLESVSLIRRFRVLDRGSRTARCQVEIDPEIVVLFAGDHYTKFVWQKYRQLSPTARRMFDYFATHKVPFPLKLETFRLICGSDSARINKWAEQVNKACDELREVGLVKTAWVKNGLVHCKRG